VTAECDELRVETYSSFNAYTEPMNRSFDSALRALYRRGHILLLRISRSAHANGAHS
jgi:hypothetical protein